MDRTELAWAAGFWDGEGSAYLSGSRERATRHPQARINQASTTGIPQVLIRFQRAVGLGAVQGPDLMEGREPLYRWVVSSRADVCRVGELLAPWLGEVKRWQFEAVVGRPLGLMQWTRVFAAEQCAWVAGLWDGEGSVCLLRHRTHAGYFVGEANLTQSSPTGVPEVLRRLGATSHGGHIYGPFKQKGAVRPVYKWRLYRTKEIGVFFDLIWPWLGNVKRDQATSVFATLNAQPPLPRGNLAWGSHKTHCVHGHEYATARILPFRSRGKNSEPRRASKQCLGCVREHARQKRIERKRKGIIPLTPVLE